MHGSGFTETGKRLAIALTLLFVLELILYHWLQVSAITQLFLYPLGSGLFRPWQIVTHPLVQGPNDVLSFLFQLLALYFFGGPVEAVLGRRRFLVLFLGVVIASAIPGLLLTSAFFADMPLPYGGLEASSLALLTAFALLNRNTSILLFFVLPVQAIWLLYGTAIFLGLSTLARATPHGLYYLMAMGLAYLYVLYGGPDAFRRFTLRYQKHQTQQRLSKFRVVEGGKGKDPLKGNGKSNGKGGGRPPDDDEPMYH